MISIGKDGNNAQVCPLNLSSAGFGKSRNLQWRCWSATLHYVASIHYWSEIRVFNTMISFVSTEMGCSGCEMMLSDNGFSELEWNYKFRIMKCIRATVFIKLVISNKIIWSWKWIIFTFGENGGIPTVRFIRGIVIYGIDWRGSEKSVQKYVSLCLFMFDFKTKHW